jgi:hypothetical protein
MALLIAGHAAASLPGKKVVFIRGSVDLKSGPTTVAQAFIGLRYTNAIRRNPSSENCLTRGQAWMELKKYGRCIRDHFEASLCSSLH